MRPPVIRQNDSSDCAAACVAMVAAALGKRTSLAELRYRAGTDREGTTLEGIRRCASSIGLDARVLKGTASALTPELPVPFIAHVNREGAWHFVVVYRVGKRSVSVADPAEGRRRERLAAFLEQWTGYAVFLAPGSGFAEVEEASNTLRRFLPVLKPHVGTIARTVIASVIITIFGIASAMYFRFLIDEVLFSESRLTLHAISLGVVIITLLTAVLGFVRGQMLLAFSMKVDLSITLALLRHIIRLPLSFFDLRKSGEVLARLWDTRQIRDALSSASFAVFFDLIMVVAIGVALALQSFRLFLVALAFVPISAAVVWGFAPTFRRRYQRILGGRADSHALLVESVQGIATVKAHNAEEQTFHQNERRMMDYHWPGYRAGVLGNWQGLLVSLIDGWGSNILFWIGSVMILGGTASLGQLVAFNAMLGYFLNPLQELINLQPSLQEAFVAARRVGEILDLEDEQSATRALLQPEPLRGKVAFRNVSFRYGSRRRVLEDISFDVPAGSSAGFVGKSGSGKSTIVKLLLGFYAPEGGTIEIGGTDLRDMDLRHMRERIGYVSQNVFLFNGSIRENIALGRPGAGFEEILNAAKRAHAHEFVHAMPERYETVLSEGGRSLSGGERQRLAIARSLLGRPDIIIFDEATSDLDTVTEGEIIDSIRSLQDDGITTIIVAHRLSSVTACDRIVVMDNGTVAECGTHGELKAHSGIYASLWERFAV